MPVIPRTKRLSGKLYCAHCGSKMFRNWAKEFDNATNEQKKIIACQLLQEIGVSRDYELDIVFNINYEQFLLSTAADMATAG